jgi:hypothetical protein
MEEERIMSRITDIEKEIEDIKKHMVDADSIMTEEDYEFLLAYRKEKTGHSLTSHDEMKKKLGI